MPSPNRVFNFFLDKWQILTRPTFWVPVLVMTMVGSLAWVYVKNPYGFRSLNDEQSSESEGSLVNLLRLSEDGEFEPGADNNNLLLLQELDRAGLSGFSVPSQAITAPKPSSTAQNSDSDSQDYFRIGASQASNFNAQNSGIFNSNGLFGSNPQTTLGTSVLGLGTSLTSNPLNGFNGAANNGQTASFANPLQDAMERYGLGDGNISPAEQRSAMRSTNRNWPGLPGAQQSLPDSNPLGQNPPVGSLPGQNLLGANGLGQSVPGSNNVPGSNTVQSFGNPVFSQPIVVPNASSVPVPGYNNPAAAARPGAPVTAPGYLNPSSYGVPPAVPTFPAAAPAPSANLGRSPVQSADPVTGQVGGGFQSGQNQNFGNPAAGSQVVTPPPAPFSAPRSVPGRYIGGGQINTFGNP